MFMHIVTQLSGRITALYTRLWALLATQLWPRVKRLHASFIQIFQSVVNQYQHLRLLLALTQPSTNRLRANLITVVALIKQGLTSVKAILIQTGQQLATTVRLTLQHVMQLWKKDK